MFLTIINLCFYKVILSAENCFNYLFEEFSQTNDMKELEHNIYPSSLPLSSNFVLDNDKVIMEDVFFQNKSPNERECFTQPYLKCFCGDNSFLVEYSSPSNTCMLRASDDKSLSSNECLNLGSSFLNNPLDAVEVENYLDSIKIGSCRTIKDTSPYVTYIDSSFFNPLYDNFSTNFTVISQKLQIQKNQVKNDFYFQKKLSYYKNLAYCMEKVKGQLRNSENTEQEIIKLIDSRILSSFEGICNIDLFKEIQRDLRSYESSIEENVLKIRVFYQLIHSHFLKFFILEILDKVNFRILIKKEIQTFIKQYKDIPEVLNIEILLKEMNEYGQKPFAAYILLKLMNYTLKYKSGDDLEETVGIFHRCIIVLSGKYKKIIGKFKKHKNVENSCFGMIISCIDVIDYTVKSNLRLRLKGYNPSYIYSSLLDNKQMIFKIFLILNIYLYNNCKQDNCADSKNSSFYLTNALKTYASNYNNIKKDHLLKACLLIYNYLIHGNSYIICDS